MGKSLKINHLNKDSFYNIGIPDLRLLGFKYNKYNLIPRKKGKPLIPIMETCKPRCIILLSKNNLS